MSIEKIDSHAIEILQHHVLTAQAIGTGRAHSKIILMGEHAVVYDYPAIALPFPAIAVEVTATLNQDNQHYLACHYYTGPLKKAPQHLDNIQTAIQLTLDTFQLGNPSLNITITSAIPQERGMGSSAAVTVAVVRAIADLFQLTLSDYQLHFIVNQAEVIAHQSTSGIDTLMTSTYHPVIYRKSRAPHAFDLSLSAYLVVADSGQAGQTKSAVHHVAQMRKHKPYFVDQAMQAIGNFVQQAYDKIAQGNAIELGKLMTYNHYYLNQLGVSNSHLDKIVNAAWMAGALGAKLTGGGRGGCLIALAETKFAAKRIAKAMRDAGAVQTWHLNLETGDSL
ncbi:mevalonate kinase [Tuanshanicoccus lijuaniae]|uniref:mevalonate kinase n=1 Tax=Aerococcaceae bacterium zg-1292 TaxID=2774330 RepID=UPI0040644AF8